MISRAIVAVSLALTLGCGSPPEEEPAAETPPSETPSTTENASPVTGVTLRQVEANGIQMRIAEAGSEGPLVLLAHGWPESWYSWRHQLTALAAAGYRAVAPDMRGYGDTDAPPNVEDDDIEHLAADMVGLIDALGEERAVIVGHDWGALVAWNSVLLHPDRFSGLVTMSVPYGGRHGRRSTTGRNGSATTSTTSSTTRSRTSPMRNTTPTRAVS